MCAGDGETGTHQTAQYGLGGVQTARIRTECGQDQVIRANQECPGPTPGETHDRMEMARDVGAMACLMP